MREILFAGGSGGTGLDPSRYTPVNPGCQSSCAGPPTTQDVFDILVLTDHTTCLSSAATYVDDLLPLSGADDDGDRQRQLSNTQVRSFRP